MDQKYQYDDAKTEIFARLRNSLSDHPTPPAVPREYRRVGGRTGAEVVDVLIDRLEDYKANVYREKLDSLPERIGALLEDRSCVIPSGLYENWLPDRDFIVDLDDQPLTISDLDSIDAVLTGSTVACADTGTIFLSAQPNEGRRAITLVPDHHVCVVFEKDVVDLVPQALEAIESTQPITMISGPSATSDIELERVEGVHGPRRLDIIIVAK